MSFALALAGHLIGEKVYVQYIEFGFASIISPDWRYWEPLKVLTRIS